MTRWRATGPYTTTNSARAGILEDTRLYLLTYGEVGDIEETRRLLIDERLPQRSRAARTNTASLIQYRLAGWNPPAWVLDDLAAYARETDVRTLNAALLLHLPRQDAFLYDLVQEMIWPRWIDGERVVSRSDVQRFLDEKTLEHPEIENWSTATRNKLASNALSILYSYGLLAGKERSQMREIVEPVVPDKVTRHLIRLLRSEGIAEGELATHLDWRLWLWDEFRAATAIARLQEYVTHG